MLTMTADAKAKEVPDNSNLEHVAGNHIITFEPEETQALEEQIRKVTANPYTDTERFLLACERIGEHLPERIRDQFRSFWRKGNLYGAVVIRGLPIDKNLPPTPFVPQDPSRFVKKYTFLSEANLAIFGTRHGGEPIASEFEKQGQLFQNMFPTKEAELQQTSESSRVYLEGHVEWVFLTDLRPDFVELVCLRGDHNGAARTYVCPVGQLLTELTDGQIEVLRRHEFVTTPDPSFLKEGCPSREIKLPVFSGPFSDPILSYDLDLQRATTYAGEEALARLKGLIAKHRKYVVLKPGSMIVIDNRRTEHERSQFHPRYDGRDRWLQRMLVTRDLSRSEMYRLKGERIIRTSLFYGWGERTR